MRKTALGILALWAIPAYSYDLNAAPTINGLQLVDSDSQRVSILGASEVLPMEPEVFSMLDGITGLLPILSEQKGINRIGQFDAIGPVSGGLFRAYPVNRRTAAVLFERSVRQPSAPPMVYGRGGIRAFFRFGFGAYGYLQR